MPIYINGYANTLDRERLMLQYYKSITSTLINDELFIHYAIDSFQSCFEPLPFWIWGGGEEGSICHKLLKESGFVVNGIIDNNTEKSILGFVPPKQFLFDCDCNLIFASTKSEKEMDAQFRGIQVNCRVHIYSYSELFTRLIRDFLFYEGNILKQKYNSIVKDNLFFFGNYKSWDDAIESAKRIKPDVGYSSDIVFESAKKEYERLRNRNSSQKVVNEDSEFFECISAILYVLQYLDKINLLDFGGALGKSYYKYKFMLDHKRINWNIVEQKEYVKYGNQNISGIVFWDDINKCLANEPINCVLLSNSLQYIDSPYNMLNEICKCEAEYIIIDKIPLLMKKPSTIVNQNIPSKYYSAIYPVWLLNADEFVNNLVGHSYEVIYMWKPSEFMEWVESPDGTEQPMYWGGCSIRVIRVRVKAVVEMEEII